MNVGVHRKVPFLSFALSSIVRVKGHGIGRLRRRGIYGPQSVEVSWSVYSSYTLVQLGICASATRPHIVCIQIVVPLLVGTIKPPGKNCHVSKERANVRQ